VYREGQRSHAMLVVIASTLVLAMGNAGCKRSEPTTSRGNADNVSPESPTPPSFLVGDAPMPTAQGVCSQTALDELFSACFQSDSNCTAWKTANTACAQCVFTPDSASVQGPFITRKNAVPKANQRGCLDSLALGCGTAYESVTACTHATCDSNPELRSATGAERAACRQAAMQGSWAPLMRQFSEKCGAGGLADKRMCFSPSGDEAAIRGYITALARRACGS
jgi:hypothetical protein